MQEHSGKHDVLFLFFFFSLFLLLYFFLHIWSLKSRFQAAIQLIGSKSRICGHVSFVHTTTANWSLQPLEKKILEETLYSYITA